MKTQRFALQRPGHVIRHVATGLYVLAEPYIVFKDGTRIGEWCAVQGLKDATRFYGKEAQIKARTWGIGAPAFVIEPADAVTTATATGGNL